MTAPKAYTLNFNHSLVIDDYCEKPSPRLGIEIDGKHQSIGFFDK